MALTVWDGLTHDTPRLDTVRDPGPQEWARLRDELILAQQKLVELEARVAALE